MLLAAHASLFYFIEARFIVFSLLIMCDKSIA